MLCLGQVPLPVISLGLVELWLSVGLTFLGVNSGDRIQVTPILANSNVSVHCRDSVCVFLVFVKG